MRSISRSIHELRNSPKSNHALTVLNDIFPFTEKNPSSENIAKWIFDSLRKKLDNDDVNLSAVTVWESETASATYFEE
jgi:6-pyruvoyltetrahydropterin/6-carboxytetrahydropterin synthase